jgi:hypothetical protein
LSALVYDESKPPGDQRGAGEEQCKASLVHGVGALEANNPVPRRERVGLARPSGFDIAGQAHGFGEFDYTGIDGFAVGRRRRNPQTDLRTRGDCRREQNNNQSTHGVILEHDAEKWEPVFRKIARSNK